MSTLIKKPEFKMNKDYCPVQKAANEKNKQKNTQLHQKGIKTNPKSKPRNKKK
jgi:hypothetical protein